VKLFERLRRGRRVVVAHLGDADHGDPLPAERTQLAGCDAGGHDVRGSRESVNVGVDSASPPRAVELEAFLLEREMQRLHRGVQLGGEADGIQAQPRDRMAWLGPENRIQVVDHLHATGIEGGRARRLGDHGNLRPIAPRAEGGAVAGDATADDEHAGHQAMIRRVSATSFFSC
jgi:hypothetical protein